MHTMNAHVLPPLTRSPRRWTCVHSRQLWSQTLSSHSNDGGFLIASGGVSFSDRSFVWIDQFSLSSISEYRLAVFLLFSFLLPDWFGWLRWLRDRSPSSAERFDWRVFVWWLSVCRVSRWFHYSICYSELPRIESIRLGKRAFAGDCHEERKRSFHWMNTLTMKSEVHLELLTDRSSLADWIQRKCFKLQLFRLCNSWE